MTFILNDNYGIEFNMTYFSNRTILVVFCTLYNKPVLAKFHYSSLYSITFGCILIVFSNDPFWNSTFQLSKDEKNESINFQRGHRIRRWGFSFKHLPSANPFVDCFPICRNPWLPGRKWLKLWIEQPKRRRQSMEKWLMKVIPQEQVRLYHKFRNPRMNRRP